jgi:alpha/beta superfamily hydrolase
MPRLEERMVAIPSSHADGEALEGAIFHGLAEDGRGALVAAPHPLYGGSMDSPVVNEIAFACAKSGMHALRFNWRGVGASGGTPSGEPADADADVDAALGHLGAGVPGPLLLAGYSFGAAAALRAASRHERVRRVILVAPPPSLLAPALRTPGALASLGRPVLALVGEHDRIAPAAEVERLAAGAPGVRVEVVPGADHFFASGLAALGRLVETWLKG